MDCSTQFTSVYSSLLVRRRACVSLCLFPLLSILVSVLLMANLLPMSLCVPVCFWDCRSGSVLAPVFLSLCMSVPLGDSTYLCVCECAFVVTVGGSSACLYVSLCLTLYLSSCEHDEVYMCLCVCVCVYLCVCVCVCERSQRRSWWIAIFHNPYKLVRRLQAILPILNLSLTDKILLFLNLKHSYYILNSSCN